MIRSLENCEELQAISRLIDDAAEVLSRAHGRQKWRPIDAAPENKVILLFAITERHEDGTVMNWKMATGVRCKNYDGGHIWEWDGRQLRGWEAYPTHWMPLPKPPAGKD